jgi:hypothetical protein
MKKMISALCIIFSFLLYNFPTKAEPLEIGGVQKVRADEDLSKNKKKSSENLLPAVGIILGASGILGPMIYIMTHLSR